MVRVCQLTLEYLSYHWLLSPFPTQGDWRCHVGFRRSDWQTHWSEVPRCRCCFGDLALVRRRGQKTMLRHTTTTILYTMFTQPTLLILKTICRS
ncbi:hypothetical protein B0T12DRAFT_413252 [Alternaria alternata]|nr:hypothetical protein B0T12DRAFT_413252 [Alternaria alternata]